MNDQPHDTVVAVDGAEKSFGAVRALDGVSFAIRAGECITYPAIHGFNWRRRAVDLIRSKLDGIKATARV